MKEALDDIARNESIPVQSVKPSNVDKLIIDHHQLSHDFLSSSLGEEDDGFEDELSDLHQKRMRNKIRELNAQFAADPTPVESNRQRHVTFKENLVVVMDSISPRHSPDLLGDEDINEKSLEEIQMLSQKSFLEDPNVATSNGKDECENFENNNAEEVSEEEYHSVNKIESVEVVELNETVEENMKNDTNETEDTVNKTFDGESGSDQSEIFGEIEYQSGDCEEISHLKQQTQDNESNNMPQEKMSYNSKLMQPLNENDENKNEDVDSMEVSHHTVVEEHKNESSLCIETNNGDINELNLYSSTTEEKTDNSLQSSFTLNAGECIVDNTANNQSNSSSKSLSEDKIQNVEQMLDKHYFSDSKNENIEQILNGVLEINSNVIDCETLGHHLPPFSNTDNLTKKVTPKKESIGNGLVNSDDPKSERIRTIDLEKISKLDEESFKKSVASKDKSFTSSSATAKTNKPNSNSKSKASSKLKPAKNLESQTNKRLPNYKGNPRSQYGLSKEECKDLMNVRKEKILEMKRKEKEEEENRIQKQEEAQKAFQAWLSKKKMQEKNKDKKPTKAAATLKEVPTKEMSMNRNRKNMLDFTRPLRIEELKHRKDITQSLTLAENKKPNGDAEEAFQVWLKRKEQQISQEEILKQLEEEEKALSQCRISRHEASRAFNKWLAKKQREENDNSKRAPHRINYLNTLPLKPHQIEAFAQTFHAYLGNTM